MDEDNPAVESVNLFEVEKTMYGQSNGQDKIEFVKEKNQHDRSLMLLKVLLGLLVIVIVVPMSMMFIELATLKTLSSITLDSIEIYTRISDVFLNIISKLSSIIIPILTLLIGYLWRGNKE